MDTTTSDRLTDPSWYSSSLSPLWDVFLSFYGKDTRRNFIANLYFALDQAGLQTFRDDPALEKGEKISSGLIDAIKDSKMSVVVLSENYALSAWCLNELVEILSCKKTKNQVVPVFYYVDPSDVRHHKGSFGKALDFQKKRYSVDMIEKWKSALAEIAELSGYHLKIDANENESDTVQEIVTNVALRATTKILHLEEYLFGVDSAVEEIYRKLKLESDDVRAVGICGMGGIGKTTIAKAFYNKYSNRFDISCFVENVKRSVQGGHLLPLLEQLLTELLRRKHYKVPDVDRGIRQLKQTLCCKKALIVLDDINQSSYSELLVRLSNLVTTGSRIMITTRDSNMLNQLKVDIPDVDIYMVKKLSRIDSLKLFSHHAFRKPVPPIIFGELSASFVTYAGGIPLALKVLGSSLRGRPRVSFWNAKLEKVREIPDKEIQKILQLSYEELDDETEKAMFLDIVFFFIGKDKDEAIHVFQSCHFFPEVGIPILVERCLLTIDDDNKLQMHNLIQDMGREVIREEFTKHGNCRHLYLSQESACDVLQNLAGTDKIEGLILDLTMWRKRIISAKIFERLPNLRLLEIFDAHDIKGKFENSFHELRYIRWHYCPWRRLPSSFRPRKLVSLDMQFSEFNILWKGNMHLMSLKTLDVSYSKNLKTTPDFRGLKLVEKLFFRGCKRLMQIHPSIGQLADLAHLDLSECYHIRELPEPIGQLTQLSRLDLRDCHSLKRLPEPLKQLTNLVCLDLTHCSNLRGLPEQLGDMKGLKMLDASYTAIEQLPDSVSHLNDLVKLNLVGCKSLKKLPKQIGYMQCLETFDASHSAIEQLPDSFGRLLSLVEVNLGSCKNLTRLPDSIWKLKLLQVLNLQYCSKLESLPDQLGKMQSSGELDVTCTAIEGLPDSSGLLSRLQVWHFYSCEKLQHVPDSTGNLRSLTILFLGNNNVHRNLPDSVTKLESLETPEESCNIRLVFCP